MASPDDLGAEISMIEQAGTNLPYPAAAEAVETLGFEAARGMLEEALVALTGHRAENAAATGAVRRVAEELQETVIGPLATRIVASSFAPHTQRAIRFDDAALDMLRRAETTIDNRANVIEAIVGMVRSALNLLSPDQDSYRTDAADALRHSKRFQDAGNQELAAYLRKL